MKKQILFLAMFTLALIFAGTNNAFGQFPIPRALDCVIGEGPLNPALGKTYTYSVSIPNNGEFTDGITYRWFVTKEDNILSAGGVWATPIADGTDFDRIAGADYNVQDAENTIDLSWNTTATLADPFFLVINPIGDNGVCNPHNTKVYKIVPMNMFTLDLVNAENDGVPLAYGAAYEECMSNIVSITWPSAGAAAADGAIYDYGTNTLIWAVTAASWTTSWTPSLTLTGVNAGENIESVTWSTSATGAANGTFTLASGVYTTPTAVTVQGTGPNVGADGEVIYIRVVLDHTSATSFFEGLVDQTITLAIDGVTLNGDFDVHYTGGTGVCGVKDDYANDTATQTLKQRPEVTSTTLPLTQPFLTPSVN